MYYNRLLLPAFLVLLLSSQGYTQAISPTLDSLFNRTLDSMRLALQGIGLGAAVQLADGSTWAGASGISSENPAEEVSPAHVFNIASVSKTLTAACILQMADEKLLSIDDPLHRWIDTFPFINPNITIRQLLRHQSGIYDVITSPTYQPTVGAKPDSVWRLADVVRTHIRAPLFQPGAAFSYSNTNYLLLGMIIEAVDQKPYHEAIRSRFTQPLALNSLSLPPYEAFRGPVSHVWLDLNGDKRPDDAHDFFSNWASWYSSGGPAGSYFCDPAEIAGWMRLLMRGDLLSAARMKEMTATVNTPFNGGTRYGLGIMERNILNRKAYGHGGDAGYSAAVWYFPDKDLSIAVLNNDGRRTSWSLIPTVSALLKTFLDYEDQLVSRKNPGLLKPKMEVFPNPFVDQAQVSIALPAGATELQFRLVNLLGQPIRDYRFPAAGVEGLQQFSLNQLGGLPPGAYFLQAAVDGYWFMEKWALLKWDAD